jgi:hypothetical protein
MLVRQVLYHLFLVVFEIGSCELFARAGFELQSS